MTPQQVALMEEKPMNDPSLYIYSIGDKLGRIYWEIEHIRNALWLGKRNKVEGWHKSEVETLAAKLRECADELEGLARVELKEAAE